jgi:hypothetical protein
MVAGRGVVFAFPFAMDGGRNSPFEVDLGSVLVDVGESAEITLILEEKFNAGPPPPPSTRLDSGAIGVVFFGAGNAARSEDDPAPLVLPPVDAAVRGFFCILPESSSSSSNLGASTVMRTGPSRRFLGRGRAKDDAIGPLDGLETSSLEAEKLVVAARVGGVGCLDSPSLSLSEP